MKKFLIFLVSIVVVVCIGLTTFYFLRNNEVITIKTTELYCNAGDIIPLDELGIEIKKANKAKKTTFDYNAGGDEVGKYIKYNADINAFEVSDKAGDVSLLIKTSNKKYGKFTVNVHIGNGSEANPYYIRSEAELGKIGGSYRLDQHYIMMNDITLTDTFQPIGYDMLAQTYQGFDGEFNGDGHSIFGLNLTGDYDNAGFFYSINANGKVHDLTIDKASISGEYVNAGILAGSVAGTVDKVAIKSATISNTADNSFTGALAGTVSGEIKMSYVSGASIKVGIGTNNALSSVNVGGLVGKLSQSKVVASYVDSANIDVINSTGAFGGFAGSMEIGTDNGTIQQSYANTTSDDSTFGAFVGNVEKAQNFDSTKANMLRHFIGNMAIVYGTNSTILDTDLVTSFDNTFFINEAFVGNPCFYDKDAALYLIRGFAGVSELLNANEYVYYAIDDNNKTLWDTTYVWKINNSALPVLRMGNIYPVDPVGEYFRRNLKSAPLSSKDAFLKKFANDLANESVVLTGDIDITDAWTPVSLKNCTIDGNGKTIKVNLNTVVTSGAESYMGLFTTVDNCTIKNLNVVVTGVSGDAKYVGGLAGKLSSSDMFARTNIENVTVTFEDNFGVINATDFGGIAGYISNTNISDTKVIDLKMNADASVKFAGGITGWTASAKIDNTEVNATVYASDIVGGVVGYSDANGGSSDTFSNITGNVSVNYNKNVDGAKVGGIVGYNTAASIMDSNVTVNINVTSANNEIFVGGVTAINEKLISNVSVSGDNIAIATEVNGLDAKVLLGGIAGRNNGTIEASENFIANVGTLATGKSYFVGGVSAENSGKISTTVVSSNLYGNYVAGIVTEMNNSSATVDQVVVGKYDTNTKSLSQNIIKGDVYVAGVSVNLTGGKITNIQAASEIIGATNSTRSSLIVLVFPYGTELKNATIDSSLSGYGIFYRETWKDFAITSDNNEYEDGHFNLYANDTHHGSMQSVVINTANKGVDNAIAAMGDAFAFGKSYTDSSISSYIKTVNGFNDVSQFTGPYEFTCAISSWFNIAHKVTKTLTFNIGGIWEENNGISLIFLNNL
ncbi:MAG: hypothetical protein E7351_00950 [Clostridiales bacterium]|nr:hypothetical protein [Clostridiales bacterium]